MGESFSIFEALKSGWAAAKPQWKPMALAAVTYLAVSLGLEALAGLADKPYPLFGTLARLVAAVIVTPIMSMGLLRIALNAVDRRRVLPAQLFGEGGLLPRYWGTMVLFMLPLLGLALGVALSLSPLLAAKGRAMDLLTGGSPLAIAGLLAASALVYLAIGFALRMSFCVYALVDTGRFGPEALRASWDMTRGKAWRLAGFVLALVLLNVVGLCLLVVGLLATVPASMAAHAWVYRRLSGPAKEGAQGAGDLQA